MIQQWRRRDPWLLALAAVTVAALGALFTGRAPAPLPDMLRPPVWEYLSDRPWVSGDTGWLMVGNEGLPAIDGAFLTGEPLTLSDHTFGKGFGVFTPSELVYQLDGAFSRLEAVVGVEPDDRPEPPTARRVQFIVFGDGEKLYESPLLTAGDAPLPVAFSLRGVERVRLLTVRESGAVAGARAVWGDVRVQREDLAPDAEIERARLNRRAHQQRLQQAAADWQASAAQLLDTVEAAARSSPVADDAMPRLERLPNAMALLSDRLAVTVAATGPQQGALTVIDRATGTYLVRNLDAALVFDGQPEAAGLAGGRLQLDEITTESLDHAALGSGQRLSLPFLLPESGLRVTLVVTVFTEGGGLLVNLNTSPLTQGATPVLPVGFRYRTARDGAVSTGADAHYLTSLVRLRHAALADDGIEHEDYLGWSNPLYLYDADGGYGALVAALDETAMPPLVKLRRDPGRVNAAMTLDLPPAHSAAPDGDAHAPSLYIEAISGETAQQGFSRYRRLMDHLAPPPPLPDWIGPQWLSWYVYYMDMDESVIVRQIDQIAEHFADLGPWHIIVDAGWYRAEGLPGAEWRTPDTDKFSHGLRWLVDYAHERNVKVVLYFSAPYLNTNEVAGNWLGLRGIVDEHPEWVIPLDGQAIPTDYVYNFQHPGLRQYLRDVMRDYFVTYDVDGLKLDGLGSAGESVYQSPEGAGFALSAKAVEQTLEIYRFVYQQAVAHKPNAYIESGWLTPTLASRYSHTFRYGDEEPSFSRSYPLPGLKEHIDFTAYQQGLLGQRSNIGAVWGDANESEINRWWLGAALALGAQVSISVDLGVLTDESIQAYRSYLAHYQPYTGVTRIDDATEQQVFSTEREGVHYVGVLNRAPGDRSIGVTAERLGLPEGTPLYVFDTEGAYGFEAEGGFAIDLPAESFRLLVVRTAAGMLWGNARTQALEPAGWQVTAPPSTPGTLYLYARDRGTLYWDALKLEEGAFTGETPSFEVIGPSLIRVSFPAGGEHQLRLEQ